jgi:hypothetical protein
MKLSSTPATLPIGNHSGAEKHSAGEAVRARTHVVEVAAMPLPSPLRRYIAKTKFLNSL